MVYHNQYLFPDPETSDKQGLLAMGGDLEPARILQAYSQGIFPWFEPGRPILWWSPNPRLILLPAEFKVSHSLKQALNKPFRFAIDTDFSQVIHACANSPGRIDNTWITNEMTRAYCNLHEMGYAHSFEVWDEQTLVGGLYGVSLGKAFFGESMFHRVTNASKMALYFLSKTMLDWEFDFIDCQLPTAHLQRMGAKIISRKEFLYQLRLALESPDKVEKWHL